MSIKFDLTDAKLSQLVSNAILEQMDGEMRALVIKQAIEHLTKPDDNGSYYSRKESPIQQAFNQAVGMYAHGVVRDWIEKSPDVRVAIVAVLEESAQALLTTDNGLRKIVVEALVESVAELRQRAND